MKIALVFPPADFLINQMVNPPLGMACLSAYLKKHGYNDVTIHHVTDDNVPIINADVIGIGFTTPQFNAARNLLNRLRPNNPKALFVAGGIHATARAEECLAVGFDTVVVGEGENALLSIVIGAERGVRMDGIIRGKEIEDIDTLPFPDYSGVGIDKYHWVSDNGTMFVSMLTSRGCPMACRYCASKVMWKGLRLNSVEYVKRHIDFLRDGFGVSAIVFQDDVFTVNKTRLTQIANHLNASGIVYRCLARANNIDKETVRILLDTGCVEVCFGIESGNQAILDTMNKKMTVEQNRQAILNCKKAGLSVKVFVLLGSPGESKRSIEDTIMLLEETQPNDIDVNVMVLYPGTEFRENISRYDISLECSDYDRQYLKGKIGEYRPTVSTSMITPSELEEYRKYIFNRFSKLVRNREAKV